MVEQTQTLTPSKPDPHASLATLIKAAWAKLQETEKATEEARKAFGKQLLDAKAKVGHGKFGKWVEDHCSITHRTANRYMALVEAEGKLDSVSNLAAPQTGNDNSGSKTTLDVLDSRMHLVIKTLDKFRKKKE
jgi:Protein of unknown function (DUF3102)